MAFEYKMEVEATCMDGSCGTVEGGEWEDVSVKNYFGTETLIETAFYEDRRERRIALKCFVLLLFNLRSR